MRQYKIFEHPNGKIEAVKQGWSWPAFFFGWVWALVKKMWSVAGAVIAGGILAGCLLEGVFEVSTSTVEALQFLLSFALGVVFGAAGNQWCQNNLQAHGYEYKETVSAANPDKATSLYLKPTLALT